MLRQARWQAWAAMALLAATAAGGCGRPSVSRTLVFELDSGGGDEAALTETVVAVINNRLSPSTLGRARATEGRRFEVDVWGERSDEELARIERLVARPGMLEYRIVANARNTSASDIEAAIGAFPESGSDLLEWRPLRAPDVISEPADEALSPDATHVLALVPADDQQVTGEFLQNAEPDIDPGSGRPTVRIMLNARGGARMSRLTNEHRPDQDGSMHRLAILLDGEVACVEPLRQMIGEHSQIPARLTQAEADELALVLNSGALPCSVSKVEEQP